MTEETSRLRGATSTAVYVDDQAFDRQDRCQSGSMTVETRRLRGQELRRYQTQQRRQQLDRQQPLPRQFDYRQQRWY